MLLMWRREQPAWLGLLVVLAPGLCRAQSSPSAYTYATRYDVAHRVVGTIAPDPDGSGPLRYAATRTTYDAAGRATRVETGQLTDWQSENVAPSAWPTWNGSSGFQVFSEVDTSWDAMGRKTLEQRASGGTVYALTQYSYDGCCQSNANRSPDDAGRSLKVSA